MNKETIGIIVLVNLGGVMFEESFSTEVNKEEKKEAIKSGVVMLSELLEKKENIKGYIFNATKKSEPLYYIGQKIRGRVVVNEALRSDNILFKKNFISR